MKLLKATTMLSCLAVMGAIFVPSIRADESNKKTEVTFSGPVEIPGVHLAGFRILPAGSYIFKILDSQSNRHIVQIFSKDEKTIYATILAIPNYRLKATDKTVITFRERPAGEPEALRAWFYPGRNSGEEFVYPKARAAALAKAGNVPVLFTTAEVPVEVAEPIRSADAPVVQELKRAPILGVNPAGDEVALAQVVTPPPAEAPVVLAAAPQPTPAPAQAPAVETAPAPPVSRLPETASPLPATALVGLLALGGAVVARRLVRRQT